MFIPSCLCKIPQPQHTQNVTPPTWRTINQEVNTIKKSTSLQERDKYQRLLALQTQSRAYYPNITKTASYYETSVYNVARRLQHAINETVLNLFIDYSHTGIPTQPTVALQDLYHRHYDTIQQNVSLLPPQFTQERLNSIVGPIKSALAERHIHTPELYSDIKQVICGYLPELMHIGIGSHLSL